MIKQWGQFPDWVEREHRVLTAQVPLRLPIPRPLYYERSSAEAAWLAMEFLPGEPMRAALAREADATRRSELLTNWGAALRQLHASAPPAELRTEMDWVDRALARAAHNLAHFQNDNMTPELLRWLQENRPAPGRHGLIHGDCTVDNTLVLNGQVKIASATLPRSTQAMGARPSLRRSGNGARSYTRSSEPAMPQRGITPWE